MGVDTDNNGNYHVYSTCPCNQLQYGSFGTTYTISQFTNSPLNGPLFGAEYPTSSPYVTSGFEFLIDNTNQCLTFLKI